MANDAVITIRRSVRWAAIVVPLLASACEPAASPSPTAATKRTPAAVPVELAPIVKPFLFSQVEGALGIDFQRTDDIGKLHRIQESTGGGVALFDFDRDGWLDVYFTDGCRLPLSEDATTNANRLFRSESGHHFDEIAAAAGLQGTNYGQGCTAGDFDGDGFDDLYVAAYGPNHLWRNNGDGTFSDVTDESGAACSAWSTSVAFADFNRDGNLDLYVVNYLKAGDDPPLLCPDPLAPDGYFQCPPTVFHAADDILLIARGDGTFEDATRSAGTTGVDGKGLGVVVFDMNHDGWPDIYVANDGMPNFMYMNISGQPEAGGRLKFENRAADLGCAFNDHGVAESSMGIACGDYDADGWSDLYVTNYFREINALYRNLDGQGFQYETHVSGLGPPSRDMLGWGTEFFDADNDGWLDLFVANGHVDDLTWRTPPEPYRMPAQVFRNSHNGRFEDVSRAAGPYFQQKWLGRGMALGDIDLDGDLDIVVSHQLAPSAVLRNDTSSSGHSVMLRLLGRGDSNRSALGTRVEAEGLGPMVVREVIGGGSYQSSSDRRLHIGVGDRTSLPKLKIRWPSGTVQELTDLAEGDYIIVEGQAPVSSPSARR